MAPCLPAEKDKIMSELLGGWKRSAYCGEFTAKNAGQTCTLMGWATRRRDLGGLIFIWLRDRTGVLQIVFNQTDNPDLFTRAQNIRNEFVLAVRGEIVLRSPENTNKNLPTGEVELLVTEVKILSEAETLPFPVEEEVNEGLRFKYRYLDLRKPALQKVLAMRSQTALEVRQYFCAQGFLEIETPVLTKSTPEGARDYLVPSRVQPGKFYALPQSPQLFKQLLMVAGTDRYYQIVKCFRDEDLRADRQPEFTQIDLEMSFVEPEDVQAVAEGMLKQVFKNVLGENLETPFLRMTYQQAMERYGSDKPDLRFGLELTDITDLAKTSGFPVFSQAAQNGGTVRGINAKGLGGLSRKELDSLAEYVKTYRAKGLAWLMAGREPRGSFAKFLTPDETQALFARLQAEEGDLLLFVADAPEVALNALGQLRCELARRYKLQQPGYRFVWVTEFPLLEYSAENSRWVAMHHPFTAPMDEDLPLLGVNNGQVRAKAYDIVLNGYEIGGGSVRIHSPEVQKTLFTQLGFTDAEIESRFGFLVNAFRYGAPPHGGLAFGLDRLIMLMCGSDSIRDVIAFPKMQNAACLTTEAPNIVEDKQLRELGIAISE